MKKLHELLYEDVRFIEGLNACINCGTCTAICPAAEFYDYDPRKVVFLVQSKNDDTIEELLKSDVIWYCGECMSCITRCPKDNAPGLIIMALRTLSQKLGYFVESEKGRQQILLKRTIGENILKTGYCVYARSIAPETHPEAGPIWEWEHKNLEDIFERLHANLDKRGVGALRKIPQESLDELQSIFDVTGTTELFNTIEECTSKKAKELGMSVDEYIESYCFNK